MLPEEIVAAPIEAWRVWRVLTIGPVPVLLSINSPMMWTSDVETAHCDRDGIIPGGRGEHDPAVAPDAHCLCGFWAVPSRKEAERLARTVLARGAGVAVGRVQLWGRIVEYTGGYRAQFARPREVFIYDGPWGPGSSPDRFERLSRAYGVPVTVVPRPKTRSQVEVVQAWPTSSPPAPYPAWRRLIRWFLFGALIYVLVRLLFLGAVVSP